MKRMATLVLALLLLLSMAVPAMAENSNKHTITITTTDSNLPEGHEYKAYQVFKGDLVEKEGKKILTNIEWGAGVNSTNLLAALKDTSKFGTTFARCATAIDVADEMIKLSDDQVKAFADVVSNCLSKASAGKSTDEAAPYKITVIGDGYYFIKDTTENLSTTEADAVTRYMLQVVGDVKVQVKADVPSIDKEIIKDDGSTDDYNERSVGESEKYQITSRIPDMSAFDTYTFVMTDTFSKGLTYNEDIKIVIDEKEPTADTELTKDTHYTVARTSETNGETTLTITFTNLKQWQEKKGQNIIVTYSATINENAVLGTAGNPNSVKLKYSNNPNQSGSGDSNHSTGETPEDTVYTYVTGIKLTKTDENGKSLTGAKFIISGDSAKVVLVNSKVFEKSAEGTYYRLKDGTYTTDAPTGEGDDKYESTTEKYAKVDKVIATTVNEQIVKEGWVGTDGVISFEGLGAGTYTIEELIAPEGYNLLKDKIYIKIDWTEPTGTSTDCAWTAKQVDKDGNALKNGEQDITLQLVNGVFTISVENKAGNTLPSTGGIGTTVFYAVGGLLLVGAVIVMITRKRMSAEK